MPSEASRQVSVRMYRPGFGDCFLLTVPASSGRSFHALIDCGGIGAPDETAAMREVVEDIRAVTGGVVDLLVITHEHWDHISGLTCACDLLRFSNVWLPWTENPAEPAAAAWREASRKLRAALIAAAARMRFGGAPDPAAESLLELFGSAGASSRIMESVRSLVDAPRYCRPSDTPFQFPEVEARFFILGPAESADSFRLAAVAQADAAADVNAPFDRILQIPMTAARQMPFFLEHYWGEDPSQREHHAEANQAWRGVDAAHLEACADSALRLDSVTNNTSLVLAIELADGRVLLFTGDALADSWRGWQDLRWEVDGRTITGPDLLSRTVLYKAGHHGSELGTPLENGLDRMKDLRAALVPVHGDAAKARGWTRIPDALLEKGLEKATGGRVLRSDRPVPAALAGNVTEHRLYYELTL